MTARNTVLISISALLLALTAPAHAQLPSNQLYPLFNQANEAFRQANAIAGDPQAEKLYEKAILSYERIINETRIRNAGLYYNLANAYLLKGDLGKAILNYRRAQKLDSSDENIRKNLTFARSRTIDLIKPRTEKRVLQTLFFWHYDFALKTKFILTLLFFAALCITLTVMIWLGRSAPATVAAVICAILVVCFFVSVTVEANSKARTISGVITSQQVVARQGDGQGYPASFKDPLHEGTEFDLIEHRPGWFHIKLSDGSDGWMPDTTAELI